jgi:hypothetical protein
MISSSLVAAQTPNPQSRPESSEKITTFDIPSQPLGLALETFSTVAEIERFQSEITEWEQREYFEMF